MRRLFSLIAATFLIALAVPICAQEQTATIEGAITDGTGAALPGVTVEAVGANGQHFTAITDSSGKYRFPAVPPGDYALNASLVGMQTATVKKVEVTLGKSARVDFTMKVARMAEQITVTAEAPIVDVTSSAATTSIR